MNCVGSALDSLLMAVCECGKMTYSQEFKEPIQFTISIIISVKLLCNKFMKCLLHFISVTQRPSRVLLQKH